jgi:hypothetical protein
MHKRHSVGVAPAFLRWSLASQLYVWPVVLSTVPTAESPGRSSPFQGRFLADALAGSLSFSGLARFLSSSLVITGTLYIAIRVPFENILTFNRLHGSQGRVFLNSGSNKVFFIPKTVDPCP